MQIHRSGATLVEFLMAFATLVAAIAGLVLVLRLAPATVQLES